MRLMLVRLLNRRNAMGIWIRSVGTMKMERLGKWLFPRLPPNRREREINILILALLAGLLVAGIVVGLLVLTNSFEH